MGDKRRYLLLWMVIAIGIFIILAGIALAVLNRTPTSEGTATPASADEVQRVSISEAKAAFDAGSAVFVDVRDIRSFEAGHIPGALQVPLGSLTQHLNELNPSSWIITYCT